MVREFEVKFPNGTTKYYVEFSDDYTVTCALEEFNKSIDFVRGREEFCTADIQRHLKCGFGTVCKVLDALRALCVIEETASKSKGGRVYRRLFKI